MGWKRFQKNVKRTWYKDSLLRKYQKVKDVAMSEKKKDLTKYGFPEVSDTLKMPREAKFTTTDKLPTMPLSGRNRRIVSILKLEGQASQ